MAALYVSEGKGMKKNFNNATEALNFSAKVRETFKLMHDYNVIFDYPAGGDFLTNFTITANNLKEAKRLAQFNKRMYCRHDKPASVPANRVRVIVKRIFN